MAQVSSWGGRVDDRHVLWGRQASVGIVTPNHPAALNAHNRAQRLELGRRAANVRGR